jgi:hypothetical protein
LRLRQEIRRLGSEFVQINEETAELIAQNLSVRSRDVIEMDRRLAGDLSLNKPVRDDGGTIEWEATLVDDSPGGDEILVDTKKILSEVMPSAPHLKYWMGASGGCSKRAALGRTLRRSRISRGNLQSPLKGFDKLNFEHSKR